VEDRERRRRGKITSLTFLISSLLCGVIRKRVGEEGRGRKRKRKKRDNFIYFPFSGGWEKKGEGGNALLEDRGGGRGKGKE